MAPSVIGATRSGRPNSRSSRSADYWPTREPSGNSFTAPSDESDRTFAGRFREFGPVHWRHPMRFHRQSLYTMGVYAAAELKGLPDGEFVSVAGAVICRQQPGTAKGFVFLSLEDETGVANIIVKPNVFQSLRPVIVASAYLLVGGILQNTRGACSV